MMTIVFSAASPDLIVMTVDSAVAYDYSNSPREYREEPKSYCFPGVGCVATWGARDGQNRIGEYLDRQGISADRHSINDLAESTYRYLVEQYRPHDLGFNDVGYHVAGFDRSGRAHLFHIFWGFDRPKPPEQKHRKYERYEHVLPPEKNVLLYNGRNDLADMVVRTLLKEMREGGETRFDLRTPVGLARFGDFVARFAAEVTPEVGPPFYTYLISQRNEIDRIKNDTFCPVRRDEVLSRLKGLGYRT